MSARGGPHGEPSEEELRAAYEAELDRLTAIDVVAQATVSLLNIGARRLAPARGPGAPGAGPPGASATGDDRDPTRPGRDLDQARDAIDAVRALLEILERRIPQELRPMRDALSHLQMAYAREIAHGDAPGTGGGSTSGGEGETGGSGAGEKLPEGERPRGPGPAESSGRLWVPGR